MISDDIRAGAKKSKQCFRQYTKLVFGKHLMTCAIGAACLAKGEPHLYANEGMTGLLKYWPEMGERVPWPEEVAKQTPGYNLDYRQDLMAIIIGLNDSYRWTREKIADWIDTLELPRPLEIPPRILEIEVVDLVEEKVTVDV